MTTLQLDRVTKKFKSDVVLDEVSIEAEYSGKQELELAIKRVQRD